MHIDDNVDTCASFHTYRAVVAHSEKYQLSHIGNYILYKEEETACTYLSVSRCLVIISNL